MNINYAARRAAENVLDLDCECKECEHKTGEATAIIAAEFAGFEQCIGNLLAGIHGDGGHYMQKHGIQKACDDADAIVVGLRAENDRLRGLLERAVKCIKLGCGDVKLLADIDAALKGASSG